MTTNRFNLIFSILFLLTSVIPAGAQETSLTIDFSSTALRDDVTTADWDTVSGTLHLPSFTASQLGSGAVANCSQLDVVGNYAFVATGQFGLSVVDISDPTAPAEVYDEGGGHFAKDVSVFGDLLFVAGGSEGLHFYNITDPANPVYSTTQSAYNDANAVTTRGSKLFVADGVNGLRIMYVLGSITHISTLNTPGDALDVDAAGSIAVVADGTHLRVIDVSDPFTPFELSNYAAPGAASVQLDGSLVYLGTYAGLLILDISNPVSPTLVGTYPVSSDLVSVSVDWDYAAITTLGGLEIVDVRNPAFPVQLYSQVSGDESGWAVMKAGRIFWADGDTFRIVESALQIAMDYTYKPSLGQGDFWGMEGEGNLLYAYRKNVFARVVTVYDATDAMNPTVLGELVIPEILDDTPWDLVVSGGFVYTADGDDGVSVIDARDPTVPVRVNQIPFPTGPSIFSPLDLELEGSILLVSTYDSLYVMDLFDPSDPALLYPALAMGTWKVVFEGFWAYFIRGLDFTVVSLSSGAVVGTLTLPSGGDVYASEGNHVFIEVNNQIAAVDVQDPTAPVFLAPGTPPRGAIRDMEIIGDRLAVLHDEFVIFLDISDPANISEIYPVLILPFPPSTAQDLSRTGDFLHVGSSNSTPPMDDLHLVIPVLSHRLDYTQNYARTISLSPFNQNALSSRILPAARTDSVEVSIRSSFGDDGEWSGAFGAGGGDGIFRLYVASSLVDPMVDEVTFEWAYEEPVITGITDTPNDQGSQVRIEWMKSANDFTGGILGDLVTEYSVYRRIEAGLAPGLLEGAAAPPGDWDFITTLPADGIATEGHYSAVVSTLADSTIASGMHWSTFHVRARTVVPGSVYDSAPDSGYSVDNLAPSIPGGLETLSGGPGIDLIWDPNPEDDVQYYNVYRGVTSDFTPDDLSRIGFTASPGFNDPSPGGGDHYKVTAVDFSGNEGPAAHTQSVTGVGMMEVTNRYQLYHARPNPFRAGSRIAYEVPEGGGDVSLMIHDVQGRAVRTLLTGWQRAGVAEIGWDGRDDGGRELPVGVYFLKLSASGFEATTRLVRVR